MTSDPLRYCRIEEDGETCGIYSDDHNGVCVIHKAQGTSREPAPAETEPDFDRSSEIDECPPWDGSEPGY